MPQVVEDCHQLLLWMIPLLIKFPRVHRFTLGERLESGLLAILELLVEAAYRKQKGDLLTSANRRLAVVRHLWRLSYELHVTSLPRYEYGARLINELGAQIGSWRKSLNQPQ